MQVYHFHPTTGELVGMSEAMESPLEPGVYLVPAHATSAAPPDARPGYARVWSDSGWGHVEDHRGETVYATASGMAQIVSDFGPLADDVTLIAPGDNQSWDAVAGAWVTDPAAVAAAVRATRDAKLTACEWLVIRHRDQVDAGVSTTLAAEQYADLLAYRQALRDVPSQQGFPLEVSWPVEPL